MILLVKADQGSTIKNYNPHIDVRLDGKRITMAILFESLDGGIVKGYIPIDDTTIKTLWGMYNRQETKDVN